MAGFIEVRTTVEGHEKAAALAHEIMGADLATSIDIDEVPAPSSTAETSTWRLTLLIADAYAPALEALMRSSGHAGPVESRPVTHDIDSHPDWLPGHP
ncbi:hypothetical protein Nocox_33920 [Nonomuraea coxensis DSM 45129]|uniref:Uncharacterized protein n=1 Tax=Nonomuraea coxensis DSM 45129 TaxID=1122611 RepID=A0ABX8UA87_9ACTN|nr:hypothetical protein [Nonomuraea coxensis]QYC44351.1 hypothetical protein Nocox_33920 [Nonomuraea coxensis DSM 45129]